MIGDHMDTEKLDPTVKAKLKCCETPEEILALAQEEGYELSDDQLEGISGGWGSCDDFQRIAGSTQRRTRHEQSAAWNPGASASRSRAELRSVA